MIKIECTTDQRPKRMVKTIDLSRWKCTKEDNYNSISMKRYLYQQIDYLYKIKTIKYFSNFLDQTRMFEFRDLKSILKKIQINFHQENARMFTQVSLHGKIQLIVPIFSLFDTL